MANAVLMTLPNPSLEGRGFLAPYFPGALR